MSSLSEAGRSDGCAHDAEPGAWQGRPLTPERFDGRPEPMNRHAPNSDSAGSPTPPSGAAPPSSPNRTPVPERGFTPTPSRLEYPAGERTVPEHHRLSPETSHPRTVGKYMTLGEVRVGRMGVVYRARDADLNRIVAMKMIKAGRFATPEEVVRFHYEAEAAGRVGGHGCRPGPAQGDRALRPSGGRGVSVRGD